MKKCTENWVVQDDTTRNLTCRNIHHKWNDQMFVYSINVLIYTGLSRASTAVQRKELCNNLLIFVVSFQHSPVDECLQCRQGCLLHYCPAHLQFACPDFHQAPETHNSITLSSRILQLLRQFLLYSDLVGCYAMTHGTVCQKAFCSMLHCRKESSKSYMFLISNFCHVQNVVCFLLGDSMASEFYMPMFQNTLSVPSSQAVLHTYQPMKMEHTESSETLAYKIQTPRNHPEESI